MDNDEKSTSRDHEPPPHDEAEGKDGLLDDHKDDLPEEDLMSEGKPDNGVGDTASLREVSDKDDQPGYDASFGMPDFGFMNDTKDEKQSEPEKADDTLVAAAEVSLEMPPQEEGTGWENTGSIEVPRIYEAMSSQPNEKSEEEEDGSQHGQAKVMPFPGSAMPRTNEVDPFELLRGSGEGANMDFFAPQGGEPAEAVPDFDPDAHDSIADAVQSALRNMYGDHSVEQDEQDAEPDLSGYTVAESLRDAAAADAVTGDWSDIDAEWRDQDNDQDRYFETDREAGRSEPNTDAVLDYLYNNRRAEGGERLTQSEETLVQNRGNAPGYDRDWPDDVGADEHGGVRRGLGDYAPGSYPPRGSYSEQRDEVFLRNRDYQDVPPEESDWVLPAYARGSIPQGQYPVTIPAPSQESLASGSPDSSHLLGAAGLGLIGGIALAGVLAVFVFNSFVDEGNPEVAEQRPAKVVERLETPAVAAAQIPENDVASTEPADGPQLANVPIETQPLVQEPVETGTATSADGRLAAENAAGEPGEAIPLDLKLSNPADQDASLISLKGLPTEAKLSIGIDVGGGQWLLPPSRLSDLTVTAPEEVLGGFDLEAQLLKDDAQTPLSEPVAFKLMVGDLPPQRGATNSVPSTTSGLVIASADQAAQLAEVSETTPEIETDFLTQMLIQDGNKLMRDGDIMSARRLYEQAAASGNPEAALAMGRSYDPSYFEKLPVKTGKPDPATAFQWYKKALEGGLVTARVKIDGLKQWLQH